MKQFNDLLSKLKGLFSANKRLAVIVALFIIAAIAGAVVFAFLQSPPPSQVVVISKPIDNKTVKKPDNKTSDNKSQAVDNLTLAYVSISAVNPYTASHKKDPFLPLVVKKAETAPKKKSSDSLLEDYDISDYRLIAIVFDGQKRYASVVLPDGKSYILVQGIKIGSSGRLVHKIEKETVIFKEPIRDRDGRIKLQDVPLRLRKEE